ncbi:MAG: transposase [Opitutales bacterium]|nr:transposase [Opitutales bacterium]NRA27619.1 transposase [Opitutales bacterium]
MTKGKQLELPGTRVKGRKISLDFQSADVTSDAGFMLLRSAEERIGIFSRVEGGIVDKRQPSKLIHKASTMMRQRVMVRRP